MVFQSYQFAIFLLCFISVYFLVPGRWRIALLLFANLVFFFAAAPSAVVWLLFTIISIYGCAVLLEKQKKKSVRMLLIVLCVLLNLLVLTIFRYFPVWDSLINAAYGTGLRKVKLDIAGDLGLIAPLGISFYTLQALGYLFDVAAGKYPAERKFLKFAAFISFFPTITSGPIERGERFLPQLEKVCRTSRRALLDYDRIMIGAIGILWGFFLKMVVADRVSILVDYLYGMYQNTDSFTMLMAALFYAVQIYCDFASYSCIAAGVAQIMGFELQSNFRQPYFSAGIRSFWKRWHISLSSWLKDYVYIPLGGSQKGFLRRNFNVLLTFFVSGLWHGGAPQYLIWGLGHGVCQVVENTLEQVGIWLHIPKVKKWPVLLRGIWYLAHGILTFAAVTCLWIFFRAESVEVALVCLENLFTRWQGFLFAREFLFVMGLDQVEFTIAAAAILMVLLMDVVSACKKQEVAQWVYGSVWPVRFMICLLLLASVFVFGKYGAGYDASDFIYMQF